MPTLRVRAAGHENPVREPFARGADGGARRLRALGVCCAAIDPERDVRDRHGWLRRLALAGTGFVYCGLVVCAIQTLMGIARRNAHGQYPAMDQDLDGLSDGTMGRRCAGAGFIVYMIAEVAKTFRPRQRDILSLATEERKWVWAMAKFGIIARAVIFGLVGVFFLVAAVRYDPNRAQGLAGALQTLRRQPAGKWLLGADLAGLDRLRSV